MEHTVVHQVPRMIAVLMVVLRRPHTVADQRPLMEAVPTDAQPPRTAVADAPLEAVAAAEHLRTVAVVVVTPAVAEEDPAAAGTHPAAAEDTQAAVIRMEGATKIDLTLTARCFWAARFFVDGVSVEVCSTVLMAFIRRWRQV